MSKTSEAFMERMAKENLEKAAVSAPAPEVTPRAAVEPTTGSQPVPADRRESQSQPGASEMSGARTRQYVGRPSSFDDGEVAVKRTYRISERDDVALRLYVEKNPEFSDMSEVVRKALRAFVPEDYFKAADLVINIKRTTL